MSAAIPFSRPVRVLDVPAAGGTVELVANADERAALARDYGLVGIRALEARLDLRHAGREGLRVIGTLSADITQTCVVTLEPFDAHIEEAVSAGFLPEDRLAEAAVAPEDEPDVLVDGRADLGALVAEFLALALDPYPRRPGAVFQSPVEDVERAVSPFASLKSVVSDSRSGGSKS